MAADNKLELVVQVDVDRANASIKSVNAGLSGMEQTAAKGSKLASAQTTRVTVPRPFRSQHVRQAAMRVQRHSQEALPVQTPAGRLEATDYVPIDRVFQDRHPQTAYWSHYKVAVPGGTTLLADIPNGGFTDRADLELRAVHR